MLYHVSKFFLTVHMKGSVFEDNFVFSRCVGGEREGPDAILDGEPGRLTSKPGRLTSEPGTGENAQNNFFKLTFLSELIIFC